jgi:hypothetical protein
MSKVSSLLKANQSAPVKTGTSKVPTLPADALHDQVAEAYTAFKDAEAAFRAIETELLQKTDALYAANALDGSFSKSFNLPGRQTTGVQVTYQDRFSAIPDSNEEDLKALLGAKYSQYFEESRQLQLSDTSDQTIDLLTKKLGEETFLKLFKIKLTITAKPDMDRRQFDLDDASRAYLKQFKASVKLIK